MITRLTLPSGYWIDVKDKQTLGDEEDVHAYSFEGIKQDGTALFNIVKHRAATAAVRIKNWSIADDQGKVVPWPGPASSFMERIKVLRRLLEDQSDEIFAAISAHLNELAAAKAAAKKETQDGATDSEQSSPSAS